MLGHAGFHIETTAGGIIFDLWLDGSIFNNSWDLLEPSQFSEDILLNTKWIWISHEHPDHFNPKSLLQIPNHYRKGIKVLFQNTNDHKVVNWLINNDFNVDECYSAINYSLGEKTNINIFKHGIYDSWILINDNGKYLINLNDCNISDNELLTIKNKLPNSLDILISQFSYASWPGNPDDTLAHKLEAKRILRRLSSQINILKPKFVIPAASFVWFSNKENFWMNKEKVNIRQADQIINKSDSISIVLKPGDRWTLYDKWNNYENFNHYDALDNFDDQRVHCPKLIEIKEFKSAAMSFSKKIIEVNNRFILLIANKILGIGKPLYIYIKDHQIYGILDIQKGIYNISKEKLSNKYIELSSGTLYEMLTNPWGVDTLIISGCFKCISYDIKDVVLSLNIANLNSAGFYLNFRTFIQIRNIKSLLKIYRTWSNWNNEIGISK